MTSIVSKWFILTIFIFGFIPGVLGLVYVRADVPIPPYAYSQSTYYAYAQSTYYAYAQSTYQYIYGQSDYYAYSQSSYYSYGQGFYEEDLGYYSEGTYYSQSAYYSYGQASYGYYEEDF